jgi:hypothetical protein
LAQFQHEQDKEFNIRFNSATEFQQKQREHQHESSLEHQIQQAELREIQQPHEIEWASIRANTISSISEHNRRISTNLDQAYELPDQRGIDSAST